MNNIDVLLAHIAIAIALIPLGIIAQNHQAQLTQRFEVQMQLSDSLYQSAECKLIDIEHGMKQIEDSKTEFDLLFEKHDL